MNDVCTCVIKNREPNEEQREWLKRIMCMFHWMQTDYYKNKMHEWAWYMNGTFCRRCNAQLGSNQECNP